MLITSSNATSKQLMTVNNAELALGNLNLSHYTVLASMLQLVNTVSVIDFMLTALSASPQ